MGQALVRYLASRGCLVRSLDVLAHEFPEFGGEVEVVQSDIQDDSSVDEAVEGCEVVKAILFELAAEFFCCRLRPPVFSERGKRCLLHYRDFFRKAINRTA